MPSDRLPTDRIWQWIDEQKRPPEGGPAPLYSHDAEQTWVQAVAAALRSGARHHSGARAAHRRLVSAIQRSYRSSYPRAARRSGLPERIFQAVVAFVLIITGLAATLLLLRAAF
ncbi:MAG TPA: hypothetical protein VKT77_16685 [Chthonomonadaceae bacterium]|nr:hypothetical protein [Chthonomonadaceae bacterium]